MKLGDRVTFARCHHRHSEASKLLLGQSGVATSRFKGSWVVELDSGITLTAADVYFDAVEVSPS